MATGIGKSSMGNACFCVSSASWNSIATGIGKSSVGSTSLSERPLSDSSCDRMGSVSRSPEDVVLYSEFRGGNAGFFDQDDLTEVTTFGPQLSKRFSLSTAYRSVEMI